MRQDKGISILVCFLAMFTTSNSVVAQDNKIPLQVETRSEVPALTNFHEVVYKIWHTAWPEKDVTLLRELLPEVEQLGGELVNAQLPGILREKQSAWADNVQKMKSAIAAYRAAVSDTNSQNLLNAAEQLHSQYESMVRVVRPALKELDEFHSALYPLYHYYMPQKNIEAMNGSVAQMKEKMNSLEKATLPAKFKGREQMFGDAITRLAEALNGFEAALSSMDRPEIEKKVNALHSRYEELSKVVE